MFHLPAWIRLLYSFFHEAKPSRLRRSRTQSFVASNFRPEPLETRLVLAAGTLDPTFGAGGIASVEFFAEYNSNEIVADTAIQADGKIIAAGSHGTIARFNTNGTLDTSFGAGGFGSFGASVSAIALQPDGRIVVAGSSGSGNDAVFAVGRFTASGTLDASFHDVGRLTTDISPRGDSATDIAIQSDGKIIVTGYGSDDFAVVRYNQNGSLDTSFAGDGIAITDAGLSRIDYSTCVAVANGGKIVVGGYYYANIFSDPQVALIRYNSDGTLDSTFDGDGRVTDSNSLPTRIFNMALQGDGKIVVTGESYGDFFLARYNLNGSLDTSFANNGKVTMGIGPGLDAIRGIQIQGDGKIVVAGETSNGYDKDTVLARYSINGSLDTSFSGDGKSTLSLSSTNDWATGVLLQPDGAILVVGGSEDGISTDFALVRYTASGELDSSFSGDGKQLINARMSGDSATAIALQNDGKMIVAGNVSSYGTDFAMCRLNRDGSLDPSFGDNGRVILSINFYSNAASLLVQSDGKIVLAGNISLYGYYQVMIARYNSNGTLDLSFDGDGILTAGIGSSGDQVPSLIQQPDGKLVVAVTATSSGPSHFTLARYNTNGSFDTSFDGDGVVTTAIGSSSRVNSLAIQEDGRIIAAGTSSGGSDQSNITLVRYNHDGTLDATFDGDGVSVTRLGTSSSSAQSLAIQKDGRIVVAGLVRDYPYGDFDFSVVRFNNDGSLDSSFGSDGSVATDFQGGDDLAGSIALQDDGKIVVSGSSSNGKTRSLSLARYNTDGSLDSSFDTDGQVVTYNALPFNSGGTSSAGLVIQDDGSIVVAGHQPSNYLNSDFIVARFQGDAPPSSTVSITPENSSKSEGNSGLTPFSFTVTRNGVTSGPATINYTVSSVGINGANANDFGGTLPAGTVSFAANESSKVITIPVVGDSLVEANESFLVTLSNPSNGTTIARAVASGLIRNDDTPPVNTPPVLGAFDSTVTYTENMSPVMLDRNATVVDTDSLNLAGGKLVVSIVLNAEPTDRITVLHAGDSPNQIGVSGTIVSFGGVAIGTFSGTTTLTVNLNDRATPLATQALLRSIAYSSVSDNPLTLDRIIMVTLSDGDGGTSNSPTKIVKVVARNDAPVIGAFDSDITYVENSVPVLLDSNATVVDLDAVNLSLGRLTVALIANAESTDRIGIKHIGNFTKQIGINGTFVSYGGIEIGTFTGTTSLTVNLNAAATPAAVQALLRSITFSSLSENPATLNRTIRATLTDGKGGTSNSPEKVIKVVAKNDAPVIKAFDTTVTYIENAAPVLLDVNASVVDVDSPSLATGQLVVSITANAQATDRIGIRNVSNAPYQIGVSDNTVSYSGIAIGTFSGSTKLTVTLNSAATPMAVQALLRNITFSSISENPSTLDRTVRVTLTDGQGGISNSLSKTVKVLARNDAPIIGAFDTALTYAQGSDPILLDTNATITDADSANFANGRLTISLIQNMQSTDWIGIRNVGNGPNQIGVGGSSVYYGGVEIGTFSGTTTLIVTFNPNATLLAVQALLRNLTYRNISATPSKLVRTISISLIEGDGVRSNSPTKSLTIL